MCSTHGDLMEISGTNFGASGGLISMSVDDSTGAIVQPTSCVHVGHTMLECSGFEGHGSSIDVRFLRADSISVTRFDAFGFATESISSAVYDGLCATSGPHGHLNSSGPANTGGHEPM
jgi:hypothetical protein